MAVVIKTLTVTVATAGTRVSLGNVDKALKVYLSAPAANTGLIFVGDVTVAAANGLQLVKALPPIEISAPSSEFIDLSTIYVDAATNGDKVTVTYLQKV